MMNNSATFHYQDIKSVSAKDINTNYSDNCIKILAGCAPCQPFSSYSFKNKKKARTSMICYMNLED